MLDELETKLADVYKGAPALSPNARKLLASWAPWLALIGGLLHLILAWQLWDWGRKLNRIADAINSYTYSITGVSTDTHLNMFYWIGLAVLVGVAVLLLMAYPALKAHKRQGWRLVFYAELVSIVYGVVSLFDNHGGLGTLLGMIIGVAIVFYFLFQIRDQFSVGASAHKAAATKKA